MSDVKAICLALFIALTSCSQPQTRGQVLVAWHSLSGNKERALLDLIDRWNGTNAWEITVVPERRDVSSLHNAVLAGGANAAKPALLLVEPDQAAVYQQRGFLATLDGHIGDPAPGVGWTTADRADLFPFVFNAARNVEGNVVGIPFGGGARMMLFNRDWLKSINLDAAPANWEQFDTTCARSTDRTKGTLCFGAGASSATFADWVLAHGGRLAETANVIQIAAPISVRAIDRLAGYVRNNQAYRSTTPQQSRDDFSAGRVMFAFDWTDQLAEYQATIRARGNFDWGVDLLPGDPKTRATLYRAPVWGITHSTPERETAAWRFVRWLLDESQTAEWAQRTGEFPARASAVAGLEAQPQVDRQLIGVLKILAPAAQPEPFVGGWGCIQGVLANSLRDIYDGKPVTDTAQIAQYTAQAEVDFDCSLQ